MLKRVGLCLLVATSLVACTPKQKAAFMCRVKYGPNVVASIDKNGDAGCYRVGTAVHVTCQEDMKCWNCKTMGNHVCGPVPKVK